MFSIEKDTFNWKRFEFNQPYRCINLKPGHSNDVLPTLSWEKRCIVWMDYDSKLDKTVLADVATFCTRARSGSVLLVSMNVEPERKSGVSPREGAEFRLDAFRRAVGYEKVPRDIEGSDLRSNMFARTCRRVIIDEISSCLADRNAPLPTEEKLLFRQIALFTYADDAAMLTLGGLLVTKQEEPFFDKCAFDELPFFRESDSSYAIKAPKFTPKELRHLNSMLPRKPSRYPKVAGIPDEDIRDYATIYRYYPSFGEIVFG
ncbi:MAG: hypothetical protein H0V34_04575 [Gammaproteobacteria bacterium]|nr:hypothetical protein [Gammaproteobacteria bacterium]